MCQEIVAFYTHAAAIRRMIIGRSIYPLLLIHVAMVMPNLVQVIANNAPFIVFHGHLIIMGNYWGDDFIHQIK